MGKSICKYRFIFEVSVSVYMDLSISTINAFQKSAVLRKFALKEVREAW